MIELLLFSATSDKMSDMKRLLLLDCPFGIRFAKRLMAKCLNKRIITIKNNKNYGKDYWN